MKPYALILLFVFLIQGLVHSANAKHTKYIPTQKAELATTKPAFQEERTVHPECLDTARLLIKTNLLYDALLMPSLEFEFRLNRRWSLLLEGNMAWWKRPSKHKYYQIATTGPEIRYWLSRRAPWHGHYIGAFGSFTWFDLENGQEGYKGEAILTGLTYGYMFPIGRRLSLDAGIGIGFLTSEYEEYIPYEGHYVYQQTERFNYFGPLKLKLALTWRLPSPKAKLRKGGGR